ncbi:MAG: 4a-hydroxytetrahydrobiopterin dehydratase [Fibrobacterota bacterium]
MRLSERSCSPDKNLISSEQAREYLNKLDHWSMPEDEPELIRKEFIFNNYMEGAEFVMKVASSADSEDHHPDMTLKYKKVEVAFTSHKAGGLTENDFIMAKKTDKIFS